MADRTQADLEQILSLLNSLKSTINQTRSALEQAPRGLTTWVADAEKLVAMQQTYNRLLQEANSKQSAPASVLSRLQKPVRNPAVLGGSSNQAKYGEAPLESTLTDSDLQGMLNAAKGKVVSTQRSARALEREAKAAEKAAAEAERLAKAREKVANEAVYSEALAQAQARGLSVKNLQSIEDRGGGVQRLKFSGNIGGINQQFNPYVNMATGASTPGLSSQFRSFGSDIIRDIGQFTKWSIAIAAVYTPMQKLGELITIMIDNESKLADATIAANVPFEKAGEIFDTSAEAANRAGEAINTTIDAYAQAIRAVGRYTSESEKSQKATALLNDSLILSKLSALDQATAIDTLSAALLQSDRELDQGQELLNKWVRVSQIANVSIDGLATGVAVLGDSAETVGLSIDQLNGLIAVLSEQSISGSKEAANTAKALVGAYQSDKAEAALNKYGVALRKANGEVRGFLEIYQDLAKLRQQGILSEAAVSEVALALGGGGVRRAKDASALINSTERLNNIAKESASVTGADTLANDALAKKLETVQTANTRLANSFQSLAQTLGDDGGLLDLFKGMINLLTGITTGVDKLFEALGRSGPVLATFATGLIALNAISGSRKATMLAQLQPQFAGFMGGQAQFGYGGGVGGLGRGILGDILQMNRRGGTILGGAAVIGAGVSNLQAGRNEQAVANVVGGIIGGAIGATLGGGVGIAAGAAIGSSVADSAVSGIMKHSQDLADFFAQVQSQGAQKAQNTYIPREATTEELIKQLYQATGGGNEFLGGLGAKLGFGASKILPFGQNFATPEAAAMEALKARSGEDPEAKRLYLQLQRRFTEQNAQQGVIPPGTSEAEVAANRRQIENLQRLAEQERTRQLSRVSTGELRPSEFGRISERLGGFSTTAKQSIDAFGNSFIQLSKDVNNVSDAYNAFLELTVNGTDEQQQQINQYISDIQKLQAALDALKAGGGPQTVGLTTGTQVFNTAQQIQSQIATTQQQAAQFTNAAIISARLQKLQLPGIVGSATEATSGTDIELIKNQASKLQEQFYTDMNLTNDEIEHLKNSLDDFSVLVDRAGEDHFETITGIDQKFWDAAQKLLMEQGKIKDRDKGIGFQQFDVPMGTLEMLAQRSLRIGQGWQQKYNYDFKPEDQIAIDNQGIVQPLHADFKILALLLEKLNEKAQKQLDGQYNIPEGATFWVPLTAAYYRNQGGTGGGGLDQMLKSMDFTENTSATDRNTMALDQLTSAMQTPYDRQAAKFDETTRGVTKVNPGYERKINRMDEAETKKYNEQQAALGYRGDLGYGRQGQQQGIPNPYQKFPGLDSGLSGKTQTQQVNPTPTTKLDLRFSSNVNLMVDGRVLANAMQSYLASELLRTEQSQGTVTKRYVI